MRANAEVGFRREQAYVCRHIAVPSLNGQPASASGTAGKLGCTRTGKWRMLVAWRRGRGQTLSTSGGFVSTATPAPPRSCSPAPPSPAPCPGLLPTPVPGFEGIFPAPPSSRAMRSPTETGRSPGVRRAEHIAPKAPCRHVTGALLKPKAAVLGITATSTSASTPHVTPVERVACMVIYASKVCPRKIETFVCRKVD